MRDLQKKLPVVQTPNLFNLMAEIATAERRGHQIVYAGGHRCIYCREFLTTLAMTDQPCVEMKG